MDRFVHVVGLDWSCVRFFGNHLGGVLVSSCGRGRIKSIMGGWQVHLEYCFSGDRVGRMVGGLWLWCEHRMKSGWWMRLSVLVG